MKQIADIEGAILSLKEIIWEKFGNVKETLLHNPDVGILLQGHRNTT
jgi:hypothetical protein